MNNNSTTNLKKRSYKMRQFYKSIFSREIGGDLGHGTQKKKLQTHLIYCGKVKQYNDVKGYGFIIECGDYSDIFFHKSEIQNFNSNLEIKVNIPVCFSKDTDSPKGPIAKNVEIGCTYPNCIAMCT